MLYNKRYKKWSLVAPRLYNKVFKVIMEDDHCHDYLVEIIHELTNT